MPVTTQRSQHVQRPEVTVSRLGPDQVRIAKTRPQHHDITLTDIEAQAVMEGLRETLVLSQEIPAGSVPAQEVGA